jgi:hypothetical protein
MERRDESGEHYERSLCDPDHESPLKLQQASLV